MMGMLLGFVLIFLILLAILLGLSVGLALLLHWLLPAVGLELALLSAILAVGQTMLLFGRLIGSLPPSTDVESDYESAPIVILDREVALPRRRRKRM
jgi:hypothetical protein